MRTPTLCALLTLLCAHGYSPGAAAQQPPAVPSQDGAASRTVPPAQTAAVADTVPAETPTPSLDAAPVVGTSPSVGPEQPVTSDAPASAEQNGAVHEPDQAGASFPKDANESLHRVLTIPAQHRIAVLLNVESHWNSDPGFRVLSDNAATVRWGFSAGYDLLDIAPAMTLVPEIGFRRQDVVDSMANSDELGSPELRAWDLLGAVSLRYRYLSWFGAHVRAQFGAAATTIGFSDEQGVRFEDTAWAPFVGCGLGVDLEKSVGKRLSIGGLVEGGYIAASAPNFRVESESDAADDAIPIRGASLGRLGRSGAYLRLAGLIRF